MKNEKIYIEEEHIRFFWALFAFVCIGAATYILANAFTAHNRNVVGYRQILSLCLLALGGYGIIKMTSPLFQFVLKVSGPMLTIEIWNEGDETVGIKKINLHDIEALRISPHSPRAPNEALFDFSTNFHLLYKERSTGQFVKLIYLEGESFALKVQDIRKIIRFLHSHKSTISIPRDQSLFLE